MLHKILNNRGESYVREELRPLAILEELMQEFQSRLDAFRLAYPEEVYAIQNWRHDDLDKRHGKPLGDVVDALQEGLDGAEDELPNLETEEEKLTEKLLESREYSELESA